MNTNEFTFAGFTFPRRVADMATGPAALRRKWAGRKVCGPYTHAPTPDDSTGKGFYLNDAGQPFERWVWCDDINPGIRETGWFCDAHGDQTIRGIVAQLPHGRFLAGWAMGEGMAAEVDSDVYTCPLEAARAANDAAERAAEREREYQAQQDDDDDDDDAAAYGYESDEERAAA